MLARWRLYHRLQATRARCLASLQAGQRAPRRAWGRRSAGQGCRVQSTGCQRSAGGAPPQPQPPGPGNSPQTRKLALPGGWAHTCLCGGGLEAECGGEGQKVCRGCQRGCHIVTRLSASPLPGWVVTMAGSMPSYEGGAPHSPPHLHPTVGSHIPRVTSALCAASPRVLLESAPSDVADGDVADWLVRGGGHGTHGEALGHWPPLTAHPAGATCDCLHPLVMCPRHCRGIAPRRGACRRARPGQSHWGAPAHIPAPGARLVLTRLRPRARSNAILACWTAGRSSRRRWRASGWRCSATMTVRVPHSPPHTHALLALPAGPDTPACLAGQARWRR